ncbi:MAG: HNH endonuclease signature motif containing protein [Candidatus Cybelea sp.]
MTTCENPPCDKTFAPRDFGTTEKRYCSRRCKDAAWYARNRDEELEKKRLRRLRNPMRDAAYRAAHRDEIAERYARNRDEILEKQRAWRLRNRDKILTQKAAQYAKRRAKAIAYLGGKCVQCGATEALDFDHIDPSTKSFKISNRLNSRWSKVLAELKICQLLCRKCHVKKTELECPKAARVLRAAPLGGSRGKAA